MLHVADSTNRINVAMKLRLTVASFALALAAGFGVWLVVSLSNSPAPRTHSTGVAPELSERLEASEPPRLQSPRVAEDTVTMARVQLPSEEVREEKVEPIMVEPDEEGEHQPHEIHPMDQARMRINDENRIIQRANDAMDNKDPARLREVLAAYREFDPSDESRLQNGYAVIADCLEDQSPAARAAGERFIAEERASTLRRFVRRHCASNDRASNE
jgi:hypothetical protein